MVVLLKHISIVQGARTEDDEGIGKSVAGNTTKIHMAVDSYGLPIEFYIAGGEVHDSKAAPTLIDMLPSADYTYVPHSEIGSNRHSGNIAVVNSVQTLQLNVVKPTSIEKISDNISCHFNIKRWSKNTDSDRFFVTLVTLQT